MRQRNGDYKRWTAEAVGQLPRTPDLMSRDEKYQKQFSVGKKKNWKESRALVEKGNVDVSLWALQLFGTEVSDWSYPISGIHIFRNWENFPTKCSFLFFFLQKSFSVILQEQMIFCSLPLPRSFLYLHFFFCLKHKEVLGYLEMSKSSN